MEYSPPLFLNLLFLLIAAVLHHSTAIPPSPSAATFYPKQALPTKSGYLTVNPTTGSSIFYTFYEAQCPNKNTSKISQTPILMWLQDGPGCSSMLANLGKRVNLGGVAIGNGLTDPGVQVATHGVNAYNLGLINEKQKAILEELQFEAVGFVKSGNWSEATNARTNVLNALTNMTGLATLYDFRRLIPYQDDLVATFLNNVEVKRALGVNELLVFEVCSDVVGDALKDDVMKSAARKVWRVDGKVAGYVQRWESLSHAVVMNAGHLVPTDQGVNTQVMIQDWVLERGLFAGEETQDIQLIDLRVMFE
ncbi:hypothetical protein BUALT_Bualt12G0114200 [Buddleja alternifolia]|uniref:Uncharacterized protein n=1 Tax=Buddleja alternifolia TaxID=168488 RepID=A0AAV6WV93_9LAMI|nr:hypothetical protein BUALT_Bualt12G0114200 [Buddleja alternifolia]